MDLSIEQIFLGTATLLLISVVASKASEYLGVPSLLLFLVIGMLAGSEGPGGVSFDDPYLTQTLGTGALISILFSGGFDSNWSTLRTVLWSGIALSTVGVLVTTALVGIFSLYFLHYSFYESLLLGAIIASTDAAAVFCILRSKQINIHRRLQAIIEFESASNDPMAVLLTLGLIRLILAPQTTFTELTWMFVNQCCIGVLIGILMGHVIPWCLNKLDLEHDGLYPVFTIAMVMLTYSITGLLNGSGFLAVYLTGLTMSHYPFAHKQGLKKFHEGITWLMQIIMFLTLGLLVYPSQLMSGIWIDLALSFFLIFIARPVSVFLTLYFSRFEFKEQLMISWMGLRGAIPIILATFPMVAGIAKGHNIFNHVFFIVLTSILLQGTLTKFMASRLKVENI